MATRRKKIKRKYSRSKKRKVVRKKTVKKHKMNKKRKINNNTSLYSSISKFISNIFTFLRIGEGYKILESIVEPHPNILEGDIIVYENFGGPNFLRIQHAAIATNNGKYVSNRNVSFITIPIASCSHGLCYNLDANYEMNVKNSNHYLWIIRYNGPNAKLYRKIAAQTAKNWGDTKKVKYKKMREIPSAFARAKFFPCYSSHADEESTHIYYENKNKGSIPVKKGGEQVNMICSKFVMGAWMAALGDDKKILDKCFPVKPSNCSPGDTLKLALKPCWEVVGKLNVGDRISFK